MEEIHEKELANLKSQVKDLKSEINKIAKNRGMTDYRRLYPCYPWMTILDMKRGFDLIQKEAELTHNMNHIRYPELDKKCNCGYKAPSVKTK
jgi:hypothetical protein